MTSGAGAKRPRLLFLSQVLPFPPDGGVKIRTFNILRLLARTFDVTALCFYRSKGGLLNTDVVSALRGLEPLARVEAFPIPQDRSRSRLLWDHLRSVLHRRAYTVFGYQSHEFEARLKGLLLREHFDLIHADSLDLSYYFPLLRGIPLACTHHDAQSALLARRARLEASLPRRAYFNLQASLMRKEEGLWCPRVALNLAVSEVDAGKLVANAPGARFVVVPNGVDTEYFQPGTIVGRGGIVSVGGTTWYPNRDSLEHFANAILPYLKAAGPACPITWVGRASLEEIGRYRRDYGIVMTGYVEDVRPFIQAAECYVVPIRIGGGTRVKILDAWAMGAAVVSTSVGCEGLAAIDGENILIRDEPAEFAAAVHEVLKNRELQLRLGAGGRRTVEARYSWSIIGDTVTRDYLGLLDADAGSARQMA